MTDSCATYQLYYWPFLPGRGEFVRVVLEYVGVAYEDVARKPKEEGGGPAAVMAQLQADEPGLRPLAPPVLVHGARRLAQMPNICAYLAVRHGVVPEDEGVRAEAMQLQLTIADLVAEAHDTHHPVGKGSYYEDQKEAARTAAEHFVRARMPKFLGYFESVLQGNDGTHLVGTELSYVDLCLAHLLRGLEYAFPRGFSHHQAAVPGLVALRDRVEALPTIAAYRASDRCMAFNEHGIFRRYPELDVDPAEE